MSDYVRTKPLGGRYFRLQKVEEKHPFQVDAMCLLPYHLHCIWRLPPDDKIITLAKV